MIFKRFIYSLFLFFLLTYNSNSEIIEEIKILGNDRISKKTIILFGDIELKKNYDDQKLNKILKNLY